MPCPFCEVGVCIDPDHGMRKVLLYDVRGPSFASFPPLRLQSVPLPQRVTVSAYADAWVAKSEIVKDAENLYTQWLLQALNQRGASHFGMPAPPKGRCSGASWGSLDEGMNVAESIADLSQPGRGDPGVTLWRASCFGHFGAVGILITWHAVENDDETELGIRYLVGHPTKKGAGAALMAKVDELHRSIKYRKYPLHVTAAASSVQWYASKGFVVQGDAECNDEGPCGCKRMSKPALE
jgi:hypothetical protein